VVQQRSIETFYRKFAWMDSPGVKTFGTDKPPSEYSSLSARFISVQKAAASFPQNLNGAVTPGAPPQG
jgi:hypothetical protein